VQELRALVDGYAVAADDGDGDTFASLFAPTATLVVVGADGTERSRYEGQAAIATVPAKLGRYDRTLHLVATHRCSVEGDGGRSATGVAYCEAHHVGGGTDKVLFIRYDDTYERADDGWRFAARTVRTLWEERR
jgi:hypothetical protein